MDCRIFNFLPQNTGIKFVILNFQIQLNQRKSFNIAKKPDWAQSNLRKLAIFTIAKVISSSIWTWSPYNYYTFVHISKWSLSHSERYMQFYR